MKTLLEKVLTKKSARSATLLSSFLVATALFAPWN
jgi:hypothetical protein